MSKEVRMTQPRDPAANGRETSYEVRLGVRLDPIWAKQFDGFSLRHGEDGTTVLSGAFVDQAALHGVLQRIRDLGLPLVEVLSLSASSAPGIDQPANSIVNGDLK